MICRAYLQVALAVAPVVTGYASGIKLDINDEECIQKAGAIAAFNTMTHYTGNQTGKIPGDVSGGWWWTGGVLMDMLILYWHFTGDASNNPAVNQAMYYHQGENHDYFSYKYNSFIYNDHHLAWALAAMSAAEVDYPADPAEPAWSTLAEGAFHSLVSRWDDESCNGGLRWGNLPYQTSQYPLKTAAVNGGLFQLAARLARFTNNPLYAEWAEKIWNWSVDVHLIDTHTWSIGDTISTSSCQNHGISDSLYKFGQYIRGIAYMFNVTNGENPEWKSRLDNLLAKSFDQFFNGWDDDGKVLLGCQSNRCTQEEYIHKGLFVTDLAFVSLLAPYTAAEVIPRVQGSAIGAARQCIIGGNSGTICSIRWAYHKPYHPWSAKTFAEQMSAMAAISASLVVFKDQSLTTANTSSYTITPWTPTPKVEENEHSGWWSWGIKLMLFGGGVFLIYKRRYAHRANSVTTLKIWKFGIKDDNTTT